MNFGTLTHSFLHSGTLISALSTLISALSALIARSRDRVVRGVKYPFQGLLITVVAASTPAGSVYPLARVESS